ncbi:gag-pol polyprotein, partial [Tanacetum coccineum]
ELSDNTFSGSDHEDANEHIEKVLEIVDLFHIPNITQDQVMLRAFLMSLTGATSRWLRNKRSGLIIIWTRSTKTFAGLAAIQAQLNNLGREIKKVNAKVYVAQVGLKRREENSNMNKEIQDLTDAAVRNQRASIKTLEIQIGKISKTYLNLGLGELAHTKLTVELANRTVKYPKGIAENVLLGIGKFVFPVDFIILDMPEDVKVPLILRRPFLSIGHAKIDVLKIKIILRVGDDKIIFKSVKPASSLIKRVYMLILRERMELDLEARIMGETLVRDQVDDLIPTIEEAVENMDGYRDQDMGDIILGEPLCKASCVEARRFDGLITIHNGSDNVT